jgi:hypothetical protein
MNKTCILTAAAVFGIAGAAMAFDTVVVDLSGLNSNGFQGDPTNEIIELAGFNVGDIITDIEYTINLTPVSPSWSVESVYSLTDGGNFVLDNSSGAFVFDGSANNSDPYSGAGVHDIDDYVMTTDTLTIELHEWDFDDIAGGADATYGEGSFLTINYTAVPAPGALALLGIGGLAGLGRRRRA